MILQLLQYIDLILYAYMLISVGYVFIFAIASHIQIEKKHSISMATNLKRFVILIPAYKEDKVILDSVLSVLKQNYPSTLYDVVVISDKMKAETNTTLRDAGAEVLTIHFKESSKAKALNFASEYLKEHSYDYILILDADNIIPNTYLQDINTIMVSTGYKVLQTHRKAKNLNSEIAILDAIIEEMNNSIFRQGHVNLGFSSALIGSGMIFDYHWFLSNIKNISSTGEDKEFEELLLRQQMHIHYTSHIVVWDEKVQKKEVLQYQRRRWIATQFYLAKLMWPHIFKALQNKNGDYLLKTLQTFIFPRSILLGILGLICIIISFISLTLSVKWWIILILYLVALYMAIPASMRNKQLYKVIRNIPYFIYIMILNLFHLKGAEKKFIHTEHG